MLPNVTTRGVMTAAKIKTVATRIRILVQFFILHLVSFTSSASLDASPIRAFSSYEVVYRSKIINRKKL